MESRYVPIKIDRFLPRVDLKCCVINRYLEPKEKLEWLPFTIQKTLWTSKKWQKV